MGLVYPPAVYDPLITRLNDLHPVKLGIGMSFRYKARAFYNIDFIHVLVHIPAMNHKYFVRYLFSQNLFIIIHACFQTSKGSTFYFLYDSSLAKRTLLCYYARRRLRAAKTMEVYTNEQD